MKIAGFLLLYAGILFTLIATVGLFRFDDTYKRVKAQALIGFPGAILIHIASSLLVADGGSRGWITALHFLVSGPVVNHVILLTAHRMKVARDYPVDDLRNGSDAPLRQINPDEH